MSFCILISNIVLKFNMNIFWITNPICRDYFPKSEFVFVVISAENSSTVIISGCEKGMD